MSIASIFSPSLFLGPAASIFNERPPAVSKLKKLASKIGTWLKNILSTVNLSPDIEVPFVPKKASTPPFSL